PPDALTSYIRNGEIPLSMPDIMALTLRNNLDIGVDRLTPLSTEVAIESFYRPFDPLLKVTGNVNDTATPATSQLVGVSSQLLFTQEYHTGVSQYTPTGTRYGFDFGMIRTGTNNTFTNFNPFWNTALTFSVTQHFLKDYGKKINTNQLKLLQNNLGISRID